MATGRKPGRPTDYTPEVGRRICDRLSEGEPLASICRSPGMPKVRTVSDWKEAHPEFSADFARARDDGFDALAAQCLTIANTPQEGVREETDADGKKRVIREDMLGHRKLQIETRLKLLAKWDPRRYGERLDLHHRGGLMVSKHNLSDAELEAIAAGSSAGAAGKTPREGEP